MCERSRHRSYFAFQSSWILYTSRASCNALSRQAATVPSPARRRPTFNTLRSTSTTFMSSSQPSMRAKAPFSGIATADCPRKPSLFFPPQLHEHIDQSKGSTGRGPDILDEDHAALVFVRPSDDHATNELRLGVPVRVVLHPDRTDIGRIPTCWDDDDVDAGFHQLRSR